MTDSLPASPAQPGIEIWIPGLHVPSIANLKEHWRVRANRTHEQRSITHLHWIKAGRPRFDPGLRWTVHLERCQPRMLDSDNLSGALKAIRDELAVCLFLPQQVGPNGKLRAAPDGPTSPVEWSYAQRVVAWQVRGVMARVFPGRKQ
jgi:hypothetical protein